METHREVSRKGYQTREWNPTFEEINVGSLQRIADATETMAKSWQQMQEEIRRLERDRDWWKNTAEGRLKQLQRSGRQLAATKGVITKLKKGGWIP